MKKLNTDKFLYKNIRNVLDLGLEKFPLKV